MRRIARVALAAAIAVGAALAARRLLEQAARPEHQLPPASGDEGAAVRNGVLPQGSSPAEGPTRDELYREARQLAIEGRSKMNKQELQEAIEAAKTGGSQ